MDASQPGLACLALILNIAHVYFEFNPDSAVENEPNMRARCKPGTAKTQKRTVSTSCLALGPPPRGCPNDSVEHNQSWSLISLIVCEPLGTRFSNPLFS